MSPIWKTLYLGIAVAVAVCSMPINASAQNPTSREYPYLYKSPRAMGMGGAYTAIGGRVDSLFYNPAGLINIPQDKGWEVNILNVTADLGKNVTDFFDDLNDAFDTGDLNGDGSSDDDQLRATNDVLARYRGKNLHLRLGTLFPALGKSSDRFAFGVAGVSNIRGDFMTHQGFGPEGFLEVNGEITYGAIGGVSIGFSEKLFAGLSVKQLKRELLVHNFTARELVEHEDDLDDYIMDTLRKSGTATGFDAGVIYRVNPDSYWRPTVGVSLMNIGDLDFKEAGSIPMTVNAGFSVNPQIRYFRSLLLGIDYVDILNNYTQDDDFPKRLRYGAELQLFDVWPVELALRAGMYEGYPTAGFDVRLLTFTVTGVMYSEEVGAYAGQDRDKRYMLTFNFGW